MHTETIGEAAGRIEAGDPAGARALVRSLLGSTEARPCALDILARSFESGDKHTVALYLYEEALSLGGNPEIEGRRDACAARVQELGFEENFRDAGHARCEGCGLYRRAEIGHCPYCETAPVAGGSEPPPVPEAEDESLGWRESPLDAAGKLGEAALGRARELAESRSVQELADRTRALGKEAAEKAKAISEREDVREASERAKQLGKEAGEKLKDVLDGDTAREVQETARGTGSRVSKLVRDFVGDERSRYRGASESGRRAIVIQWVVVGLVALLVLRLLAWVL